VHLSRCNSRWFCHRLSMTEDVDILIVFTLFSIAEAGIYIICVSTVMVRNCTHYGCPQHLNQVSNKLYPPQVFRRVCQNTHPKLSIHDRVKFARSQLKVLFTNSWKVYLHPRQDYPSIPTHTYAKHSKAFHIIFKCDRIAWSTVK
jgi:hypothetical protein